MAILELYLGGFGQSTFNTAAFDTTLLGVPFKVASSNGDSIPIRPNAQNAGFVASAWTASGLPLGVTLVYKNGSWFFTGAPTQSGTFNILLTVTANGQQSIEGPFRVYVRNHPAHVAKNQTFSGKFNESFNGALAVLDPVNAPLGGLTWEVGTGITYGPNTWTENFSKWYGSSWVVNNLPPGLSLNQSTGTITGTPTKAGTFTPVLSLVNNSGYAAPSEYASFTVQAGAPYIPNDQFVTIKYGNYFSKTFSVLDSANRPVTSWSSPDLPPGFTLNATTGALSGYINASNIALIQDRKRASYDPLYIGSFYVTLLAAGPGGTSSPTRIWLDVQYGTPKIIPAQIFNGTRGVAFSAAIAMDGDIYRPAYRWAATSPLPAGLILDPDTGTISGTPLNRESKTASLTATGDGGTGGTTVSFIIEAPYSAPIITAGQTFTGKVGSAFSATPAITDAIERPVTSWAGTSLPSWATINATTGQITGTPSAIGTFNFTLTATGLGGVSTGSISVTIGAGSPLITPSQTLSGNMGVAFSATPALTDSANRPATSWIAAGLPSWATLNATTGAITGTPTTPGNFVITISADAGNSAGQTVTISIAGGVPIISTGQTLSGKVGVAFSATPALTDSANRPATSWSATGLPSWAALNATTGAITGTPQDSGSTTITLTATGLGGTSAATTVSISVAMGAPIITSGQTLAGKVGVAFSATPSLTDAVDRPATSWSATGLPAGIAINATTGAIAGTPTAKGVFAVNFTATGSGGTSGSTSVAFTISEGAPIITAGQTATSLLGVAFTKTFSLTDSANRPVTSWSATGLPSWAALNATTGAITGTPQDRGTTTITLTATGLGGTSAATTASISVAVGVPIITAGQSFTGKVGDIFPSTRPSLTDALDRPATSWSATGLPAGLSLDATGLITGTPRTLGTITANFVAVSDGGTSAPSTVTFNIAGGAPIIPSGQTLPGKVGVTFSITPLLTDSANRPVTSWSATSLPSGLELNATTGAITGTPQDSGSTTITLTATGPGGTATQTASISVAAGAPIITEGQTFTGKVGVAFSATPAITDAVDRPATSWSATGLPSWATINATTGAIAGTPTAKGVFAVNFTATGSGGTSGSTSVAFTISEGAPIITAGQTATGKVGVTFSSTPALTDSANRPVTSWSATGLPSWAALNATTGAITGTPQDRGTTTITLTATGLGGTSTQTASISVAVGVPIITAGQSFTGKVGVAFTSPIPSLEDPQNRPVRFWGITGLPAGLVFHAPSGNIVGTPTAKGSFTANFFAVGDGGTSAVTPVIFTISAGVPTINAGQTFTGKVGTAFSATPALTDSSERPVTSWSATSLPSGLELNATTGEITGTPQDRATTTITLTASGTGGVGTATASLAIAAGTPIIPTGQTFTGKVGAAFSVTPALTDTLNRPATSWAASSLPTWATLNATTGAITGTPTKTGDAVVNLSASGSGGTSAVTPVTFTISTGVPLISAGQKGIGKVGVPFSKKYTATDTDNRPVTSWASVSVPPWATLNSATGEVTGIPTTSGTSAISLTATGSGGTSSVAEFSLVLGNGAPIINPGQTLAGKVGVVFSATPALTEAASRPATSWSATGLPAGLAITTTTGAITGTPTQSGAFSFSIAALSVEGESVESVAFTIAFGSPQIIPGQKLSLIQTEPFSAQLQGADESDRPISAWTSSDIPSWATLESDGRVHGTPPASGQFTFTVTATGPGGTDTDTVSLESSAETPVIATTLVDVKVGVLHESYFTTTEPASMPVSFWGVTGTLPAGLSLDPTTGRLFGTPQAVGTSSVSTYAQNSVGKGSATISIAVAPGVPIVSAQEFYGAAGKDFDATLQAQDTTNRPATTWSIAPALPAGLSLDTATGKITGNLTNPVRFSATLTATGAGGTASAALTIDIGAPIIAPLDAKVDFALDAVVNFTTATITSGRSKVESWTASSLPTGITFNGGVFLGRAQASGTYQITVTAQNKWDTANAKVTFVVAQGAPIIAAGQKFTAKTDSKADFEVGLVNKASRPATKWTAQGTLPRGLGLGQDGRISGTPSQNFNGTITLIAESLLGKSSASIALTIKGPIFYGDKNPVLQPGRVVKTFPSGLVMVSEVYKMRPSNEAAARSRFAQGNTLVTPSTSSTALKIFPAPDFKSQDSGFVEMVVTAYGFTGADFRRTRKRMQSAKRLTKVLEVPEGGGAPTFQGKYSESNIQILANTHTITRAVAYGTAVNPIDGAHGVTSLGGYSSVISAVTERYDVTAFGEVDEVTVTTAYEVTFTQQ